MSSNLEQLYRQVIMDHHKNPRNKGLLDEEGYASLYYDNPSCGDKLTVQFKIEDNKLVDIRHEGTGCSICCSSASVMSSLLKGKSLEEAADITNDFFGMMKGEEVEDTDRLEDAIAYQGVAKFPARIKCATLAWKALEAGIKENNE